jgi:hypothetical protein
VGVQKALPSWPGLQFPKRQRLEEEEEEEEEEAASYGARHPGFGNHPDYGYGNASTPARGA